MLYNHCVFVFPFVMVMRKQVVTTYWIMSEWCSHQTFNRTTNFKTDSLQDSCACVICAQRVHLHSCGSVWERWCLCLSPQPQLWPKAACHANPKKWALSHFRPQRGKILGGNLSITRSKHNTAKLNLSPYTQHVPCAPVSLKSHLHALSLLHPNKCNQKLRTGWRSKNISTRWRRSLCGDCGFTIWDFWSASKRGAWPSALTTAEALSPATHKDARTQTHTVSRDQLRVTHWHNQSVDIASIDSPQKTPSVDLPLMCHTCFCLSILLHSSVSLFQPQVWPLSPYPFSFCAFIPYSCLCPYHHHHSFHFYRHLKKIPQITRHLSPPPHKNSVILALKWIRQHKMIPSFWGINQGTGRGIIAQKLMHISYLLWYTFWSMHNVVTV